MVKVFISVLITSWLTLKVSFQISVSILRRCSGQLRPVFRLLFICFLLPSHSNKGKVLNSALITVCIYQGIGTLLSHYYKKKDVCIIYNLKAFPNTIYNGLSHLQQVTVVSIRMTVTTNAPPTAIRTGSRGNVSSGFLTAVTGIEN